MSTRALTADERQSLSSVLNRTDHPVLVLLHGEGDYRTVSFYAEGTRLEARVALPEVTDD